MSNRKNHRREKDRRHTQSHISGRHKDKSDDENFYGRRKTDFLRKISREPPELLLDSSRILW